MKNFLSVLLFSLLVSPVFAQGFDADASYLEFKVSNFWVNTVTGTITGWTGVVDFNKSAPTQSSFDVGASIQTINTGNEERDEHLRSADFFEVEKYPTIRFKSNRITESKDGGYNAVGTLTIKDVSKEVTLPFKVEGNQLIGQLTVDRLAYNVGLDQSTFSVGKEITVKIVCVLQ